MKKTIAGLVICLILTCFALRPLVQPGFFTMHDDTQVGRVVSMGKALRFGQFPVRWVTDLGYGYGYPIFNFYGPLPYYAGGVFYALGTSGLLATKIMFGAGILIATVTMYLVANRLLGTLGAILATVLYTYAPYHAVQIYIRGAVGEFWAFAFLPLVFLGAIKQNWAVLALGIFGVITSHTIMGYVVALGTLAAIPFFPRLWKGFLFGLGLSAFFWLPAFAERSLTSVAMTIGPTANYKDHFVCLFQLWDSPWGFAGSAPGCVDGMSFRLGKPHVMLSLLGLLSWVWLRKKHLGWAIVLGIISIVMMLEQSQILWQLIPNSSYIQYPWRLLTFSILSLSVLGGNVLSSIPLRAVRIVGTIIIIIATLVIYGKLFVPQTFVAKPDASYETEEELRFRVSKVSDEYLPSSIVRPASSSEIVRDTIEKQEGYIFKTNREMDTYAKFTFDAKSEQAIRLNRAYFPGWRYMVNGVYVEPALINGLPHITIPGGGSTVEMQFGNTWVRTIGNTITLISIAFVLLHYGKRKKINA